MTDKRKRLRLGYVIGFASVLLLIAIFPFTGLAETYMERVQAFISMDKYKDGAYWDGNSRDLAYLGWGCNAYARDFAHYCWPDSPRNFRDVGIYFEDPAEISSGDLIYIDGYKVENGITVHKEHWYAVIERQGYDELWTIEGNCDDHVCESKTRYRISKLGDGDAKEFRHGFHMPNYAPFLKWTSVGNTSLTFRVMANGSNRLVSVAAPYSADRGSPVVSNLTEGQLITAVSGGKNEYGEVWWRLANGSFVYDGILQYAEAAGEITKTENVEIGFLAKPHESIPMYENNVPFEYWTNPIQHVTDDYIPVYKQLINSAGQIWYQMDNGHYMRAEVLEEIGAHIEYTLKTEIPFGGGTVTTSGTVFHKRDVVTISAKADTGYVFRYWSSYNGGTFADSTSPNTTYIMPATNDTIVAVFAHGDYTINVTSIGGGGCSYPVAARYGDTAEINAFPDEGFYFAGWESDDIDPGNQVTNTKLRFTMPGHSVSVTARFLPISTEPTEILFDDTMTMTVGDYIFIYAGVSPWWASGDGLVYELEDTPYFDYDPERHMLHCKYAEGTSEAHITITAPNGVSKTARLIAETNIKDYDYLINGLPGNNSETVDVYKVGQQVPYQLTLQLSNRYNPGYELVAEEDEQCFTLDPSSHLLTFTGTIGPEASQIGLYLPAAGYHLGYGSVLVTDDNRSMYLPERTARIEEEAFAGNAAKYYFLPDSVTSIGNNAFPANACVFLNTASLNSYRFQENGVWFVENGEAYNEAFAAIHPKYLVRRGTQLAEAWGDWSAWSEESIAESDTRHVRTKTQYRSATITLETGYSAWSDWSSWSQNAESIDNANLKEERTRTVYPYYCFRCPTCGWHSPYWGNGRCTKGHNISSNDFMVNTDEITTPKSGCTQYNSSKYLCIYNGENWFYWDDSTASAPKTQYSYRTRTAYQNPVYGAWSEWQDTRINATETLAVETRVLYSYQDRIR